MKPSMMAKKFDVPGLLVSVRPAGSGNINDTFLAVFRTTFSEYRFILQRLNGKVFPDPGAVMRNMKAVTEHVHRRLEAEADTSDRIWQLPRIIPTAGGEDYVLTDDGECWRAISHIASATAFERIESPEHAYEAGLVLGQFQRLTSDIPSDRLTTVLEGFHTTPQYVKKLHDALDTATGRERLDSSPDAQRCRQFLGAREEHAGQLEAACEAGKIRIRPTHGDPKAANIMIDDETGRGTCIIDLDTVQPGLIHYDFGDCLRSCCNPRGEDAELSRVAFDTNLCRQLVGGYMHFANDFLTDDDRALLYDAVWVLTYELAVRFFADFIAGDVYFKTRYDGHNLHRGMVQARLCESIEKRESDIRRALKK